MWGFIPSSVEVVNGSGNTLVRVVPSRSAALVRIRALPLAIVATVTAYNEYYLPNAPQAG